MQDDTAPLVDVHAHFLTSSYVEAASAAGHRRPDGMASWPSWSAEDHLRLMDAHGIERSILSISSPGVWFGDLGSSTALCRRVNDFAADVVAEHPDRFQFFASVPLPAVDEAIAEATRALDQLGAAGTVVMTNAGGVYLSDPAVELFLDELDRRGAAVFVHPTTPLGWEHTTLGFPRPMVEFFADTTRVISAMLMKGDVARRDRLRMIVPHCGASLPLLADRLRLFASILSSTPDGLERIDEGLGRLWFDLAGTPMPLQADALISQVGTGRLLYGSDYCWTPPHIVNSQIAALDSAWRADVHGAWRELARDNAAAFHAQGVASH
ncbi:amidohydrolase family protein [Nocardioides panzhihuensis]|uniref:6-methylsalicylate decarboxylase n=1 Tax=Nocardioides panzhihuensis TaxID=860243 RepID=A0A7Z0DLL2_9ACTN|nr:amidohydrolase family protein [Nocardioides panzhihuensis]NYI77687.1 putative TIM-barrel fold metal-dependent hydrolase [Nocardioides panzhihuensis]